MSMDLPDIGPTVIQSGMTAGYYKFGNLVILHGADHARAGFYIVLEADAQNRLREFLNYLVEPDEDEGP